MSDRPTPETDAAQHEGLLRGHPTPTLVVRASFARRLERELDEARKEAAMWKANHDNQAKLKAALLDRHDLGERARKVLSLAKERDEARELAVDLQSALITTLASLIIRMGPEDVDTVENAHQVLGKAKQLLKP